MWARYAFRGHVVTVVQQWRDPFGRKMVRIALATQDEDGEAPADGLVEDDFMREAVEAAERRG